MRFSFLVFFVLLCGLLRSEAKDYRGASPKDLTALRVTANDFTCRDGSHTLLISKLNDNYCDCPDGSDEPGTSACSNGQFFCKNAGFKGSYIFSSRVDDGICDCCDGSDEAPNQCKDTCEAIAKEYNSQKEAEAKRIQQGLAKKEEHIREGEREYELKKDRLAEVRKEIESLQQQKKDLEAQKEALEDEEEAKTKPVEEDDDDDEDEEEEEKESGVSAALKGVFSTILSPILDEPNNTVTSKEVKDKITSVTTKISELGREETDLNAIFNTNYGPRNEFFYLRGRCLRVDSLEYTYELCPFDKVNQISRTGGSTTLMGKWEETEEWKKDRKVMTYNHGLRCWSGPDRSTKVILKCDTETRIEKVQEPSRCEYQLDLLTPAACEQPVQEHLHDEL